jgi:hypothetical protein
VSASSCLFLTKYGRQLIHVFHPASNACNSTRQASASDAARARQTIRLWRIVMQSCTSLLGAMQQTGHTKSTINFHTSTHQEIVQPFGQNGARAGTGRPTHTHRSLHVEHGRQNAAKLVQAWELLYCNCMRCRHSTAGYCEPARACHVRTVCNTCADCQHSDSR